MSRVSLEALEELLGVTLCPPSVAYFTEESGMGKSCSASVTMDCPRLGRGRVWLLPSSVSPSGGRQSKGTVRA